MFALFKKKSSTSQDSYQASWLVRHIPPSIKQRWSRWISKRLPPQAKVTLSHKGIFILPSAFGFAWLALILLLYLFGTNYQNNLVIGLSLLLGSVFHTCIIYSYKNLAGLTFSAVTPADAYAQQSHSFPILLTGHNKQTNTETTHQQICLQFSQQRHFRLKQTDENSVATVFYDNPRRGWLRPGRITVWSNFPLGLFKAWSYVDLDLKQLVFAQPIECDIKLTTQSSTQDDNQINGTTRAGVDDYTGLRSYVTGESLKQVAWKQMAQGKGMLTKEFNEPEGMPVWLSLTEQTADNLELKLSQLSWQVNKLSERKQVFGLILDQQTLAQNCGEQHRLACQKAIALYRPVMSMQPERDNDTNIFEQAVNNAR